MFQFVRRFLRRIPAVFQNPNIERSESDSDVGTRFHFKNEMKKLLGSPSSVSDYDAKEIRSLFDTAATTFSFQDGVLDGITCQPPLKAPSKN